MKKSKQANTSDLEDGVDMISSLPDPILQLILSRIPTTEEVIRTSILSKRWRYLWTSVPSIDIVYPFEECNRNKFKEFVSRVLEISSLDLDRFRLNCANHDMSTVRRWIDAAVRRNVKVLHLSFCLEDKDDEIELPHSLVNCESLEVLRLFLYDYRLSLPTFTGFPALRVLELDSCKLLNYDVVNDFLKSLTLLEDLSLIECETHDFYILSISCPNLKNLRIDNRSSEGSFPMWYDFEALCNRLDICCPKLVFLEFNGFMAKDIVFESLDSLKKSVIHPQNNFKWSGKDVCDLLAGISHTESLSIRIVLIEEDINLENLPKSLPNLKTVELTTRIDETDNMDVLIQILKCSPNLESLHVIIEERALFRTEAPDFKEMECTFEQLKMVRVTGLTAFSFPDDMDFIEFLLLSTPVLETMSITPCANMSDYKRLSISTKLPRLPRASTEAEIIFV